MPGRRKGDEEDEEVEVIFFRLDRYVSDNKLAEEYESRGLVPDPYAQAQVNANDPAFADERPNGTHWKLAGGGYGFISFDRWDGKRDVDCNRYDDEWHDGWWFGGVRKVSPPKAE